MTTISDINALFDEGSPMDSMDYPFDDSGGQVSASVPTAGVVEDFISDEVDAVIAKAPLRHKIKNIMESGDCLVWIIDGLFYESSVNVIFGQSGSGKTHVVMDLIVSCLSGRSFIGLATNVQRIAYVTGEGQVGLKRRFVATCEGYGLNRDDMAGLANRLAFLDTMPKIYDDQDKGSMQTFSDNLQLQDSLNLPYDLMIFDTYSLAMAGANENDNGLASAAFSNLKQLITIGLTRSIILVHHTGKATNDNMRGASAIFSNSDTVVNIAYSENDKSVRQLKLDKTKEYLAGVTPYERVIPFEIVTSTNGGGRCNWLDPSVIPNKTMASNSGHYEKLSHFVATWDSEVAKQVVIDFCNDLGLARDKTSKLIADAIGQGLIKISPKKYSKNRTFYIKNI